MNWKKVLALIIGGALLLSAHYALTSRDKPMTFDCLEGVMYIEFPNGGVSVQYTPAGKVQTCTLPTEYPAQR